MLLSTLQISGEAVVSHGVIIADLENSISLPSPGGRLWGRSGYWSNADRIHDVRANWVDPVDGSHTRDSGVWSSSRHPR